MKRTIKVLSALLILGTAFTSCTKDEAQTTPEPTPIPVLELDIRDSAVGIFTAEFERESITFRFVKDTVGDGMYVLDLDSNMPLADIVDIEESEAGFTYYLDEDNITGEFNIEDDRHEWMREGQEILFNRD